MDLQRHGIRVVCICPGIVDTEMGRLGGQRNRDAVARLKGGQRTPPKLIAKTVVQVLRRDQQLMDASYIVVDNHEVTPVYN